MMLSKNLMKLVKLPEVQNIIWLVVDRVWRMVVSLIVGVWVTRYLGPVNFGKINYVNAYVGVGIVLANLGMESFLVKELVMHKEQRNSIISTAFALRMFASLATLLCLLLFFWITNETNENLLILLLLIFPLLTTSFATIDYVFQAELKSKTVVLFRNSFFVVGALLKILAILAKADILVFAFLTVFDVFIADVVLFLYFRFREKFKLFFSMQAVAAMIKKAIPFMVANLAIVVYMKIDQILLGKLSTIEQVGYFTACTKVTEIFYFIPLVVTGSCYKVLIKKRSISSSAYFKLAKIIFWSFLAGAAILSIALSLSSSLVISLLFGSEYVESASVLALYCWTLVPIFGGVAFSQLMIIEEQQKIILYKTLIGLVLNVILNIVLIPKFGAMGAAVATIITQWASSIFANYIFRDSRLIFNHYFKFQ